MYATAATPMFLRLTITEGAAGAVNGLVFAGSAVNCTEVDVDANRSSMKSF